MDAACDCPHINRNDPRCAARLTLGHLDEVFDLCVGAYRRCPIFTRLQAERTGGRDQPQLRLIDDGPPRSVTVTCHGRAIALRATGT